MVGSGVVGAPPAGDIMNNDLQIGEAGEHPLVNE